MEGVTLRYASAVATRIWQSKRLQRVFLLYQDVAKDCQKGFRSAGIVRRTLRGRDARVAMVLDGGWCVILDRSISPLSVRCNQKW